MSKWPIRSELIITSIPSNHLVSMVEVIRHIASIIVLDFTCSRWQIFGMMSVTQYQSSITFSSSYSDMGTTRENWESIKHVNKFVETWYVTENVPHAEAFASFLVGTLVLQIKIYTCITCDSNRLPQVSSLRTLFITILYNHLWLYDICYSFILTQKLICRGGWRHHPPLQMHF